MMKTTMRLFVVAAIAMTTNVRAGDVGDTIPKLTKIAKDVEGRVMYMNEHEAKTYCGYEEFRLPTIRELALYAQSLGAQGISETEKDGYYLVRGRDSDGRPDYFYFSNEGYETEYFNERYAFWSSSAVHPNTDYIYALSTNVGDISMFHRFDDRIPWSAWKLAVRCAPRANTAK